MRSAALLLTLLGACGVGGGGADIQLGSFPQSGLGAYRLLNSDELPRLDAPYLLQAPGVDVGEVAARAEGERLRLWVAARPRAGGGFIGYAEAPTLEDGAGDALAPALAPELPWEGGRLASPSLLVRDDDHDEALPSHVLFYLAGAGAAMGSPGAVGAALSDDGRAFRRAAAAPLLAAAALGGEPRGAAAMAVGDELHLYLVADEAGPLLRARAPLSALAAHLGGGPAPPFLIERLPLFAADFPVPISSTETAPAQRLLSISARAVRTPAGRMRYDLFVTAARAERRALCAAASYDGDRYLPVAQPLLGRIAGEIQGGAPIAYRQRALLLLGLTTVRGGVAAGRIP